MFGDGERRADKRRLGYMAAAGAAGFWSTNRLLRRRRRIDFDDRVVVVTGGSRGLGLEMSRIFVREGAHVVLLARDRAELYRAREELSRLPGRSEVVTLAVDVSQDDEVQRAVEQVVERFGRVDVLVNNAGVIDVGPLEHMVVGDFERSLAVHLWGPLYTMRAAIPYMRRQGGGRIVNIASVGGLVAVPHLAPYSAGKFALVGLSDAVRAELSADNIRVTTVCPGLMRTGSHLRAGFKGQQSAEFTWFALSAAPPGVSMNAARAARRIVEACRYGDRTLVLGAPARLAQIFQALFPRLTAELMVVAERLLPGPAPGGERVREGTEVHDQGPPAWIIRHLDRASERNNELGA